MKETAKEDGLPDPSMPYVKLQARVESAVEPLWLRRTTNLVVTDPKQEPNKVVLRSQGEHQRELADEHPSCSPRAEGREVVVEHAEANDAGVSCHHHHLLNRIPGEKEWTCQIASEGMKERSP